MIGLYIHIPFCKKKCLYCSFSVAVNQKNRTDDYVRCLAQEMRLYEGQQIRSVYFGGGTPSSLSAEQFCFLMDETRKIFSVDEDAEVAVEMNPEDADASLLACYRNAGVTRLSLGAQTFNDRLLTFLGRCHGSAQIHEAFARARRAGFGNISMDLMYGFPGQTHGEIARDLEVLGALGCEHVSLYSLTVEEGSRFFVDGVVLPSSEIMAAQYLFVRDRLTALGFRQYEVSNFSRDGRISIHNANYWQGGNYLGLGMAAHSHRDGRRWWNTARLRTYIEKMDDCGSAREGEDVLGPDERLGEALVFGLRMIDGVDPGRLEARCGARLSDRQHDVIERFLSQGYLRRDSGKIAVTEKGLLVLDEISPYLL